MGNIAAEKRKTVTLSLYDADHENLVFIGKHLEKQPEVPKPITVSAIFRYSLQIARLLIEHNTVDTQKTERS